MSQTSRQSAHPIDPVFLDRWSPRAFAADTISVEELKTIFEAGRWAPSAYNSQPWRFVYAVRGTPHFDKMLGCLVEFNQSWVKNASALVFIVSNSLLRPPGGDKDVPARSHSFDAGAAWSAVALQATKMGWFTHGMIGMDFDAAFAAINTPPGYRVEAAVAIGKLGDKSMLPEGLRAREVPSDRKPLAEMMFEGTFPV